MIIMSLPRPTVVAFALISLALSIFCNSLPKALASIAFPVSSTIGIRTFENFIIVEVATSVENCDFTVFYPIQSSIRYPSSSPFTSDSRLYSLSLKTLISTVI